MAFKSKSTARLSTDSPESLFADIKTKKIPGLLTQQGDLLREYVSKFVDVPDVAAQLPTGSGKTLIALLIGEWRRITRGERVVYLCPTKQLVNQVAEQAAHKYGIIVEPFTGSRRDYSATAKMRYNASQAIAVTTYSSLFNSNPFFEDPHLIILDDAHAAEQYVASNWTIDIRQYEEKDRPLFNAICSVLRPHLKPYDFLRLSASAEASADLMWIEKIPYETALQLFEELEGVIDANLGESEAQYPWRALKGKLSACNIFLTSQGLTIRPFLAPTFSHQPFENATQRIYLSATPGEGGELERVFCRKKISRLTPPAGSERHAIGRRFFIFPELGLDKEEQGSLLVQLGNSQRVLVLVGDNPTSKLYKEFFTSHTAAKVFGAQDIETSKAAFVATLPAAAVLANRYDGIDFPNEECRITLLIDIPTAANPQEKFFINRLAATRVFDARILTRIIQAFGRCTRSATDFSAVIVFGDRIVSFLSKKDRQSYFHPELQGELLFGFEESASTTLVDTLDNLNHFLAQDEDWKGAEAQIYSFRDDARQENLQGSDNLANAVVDEVSFMNCLWNGDVAGALEACKSVLAKLDDPSLRGVRALWNYFAGSMAARLSGGEEGSLSVQSRNYYVAAGKAAPNLSWLHELGKTFKIESLNSGISRLEATQLDAIENQLVTLGTSHNREYDNREAEIRKALLSAETFEQGHVMLGNHLGFRAGKIESSGSPDPWWMCSDGLIIVFEDHAAALDSSSLSITKARQAATHDNWVRENLSPAESATIARVLVTPVNKVDNGAMCHLVGVHAWNLTVFLGWAEASLATMRELRQEFREPGDLEWRAKALGALRERNLTGESIVANLPFAPDVLKESV